MSNLEDSDLPDDDTPSEEEPEEEWEEVSLEELGAVYAKVLAEADGNEAEPTDEEAANRDDTGDPPLEPPVEEEEVSTGPVTIEGIIEAALFVGHPDNQRLTAKQLAGMIRDVSPKEVEQTIDDLNTSYAEAGQAIRILREEGGFQMLLAPELETVRRAFYGKVRDAHLSQGAVEVLALVAYQPGVDAQTVQDQRGKESGPLLNQLVRRRMLRVERNKPAGGGRTVSTYFPTDRFLQFFHLSSLEDLPHVEEEGIISPPTDS
ncbi:Segregation and condensation protein B [Roseimaritima multifibrata]|uniref:Segregation and condensation protein B n=1 Tax=Roseimaritima multifibrata TaxID=1930274 RepID=A0A517MA80_9BACT|nr:SMC-Scp complex subunit ScpB [Roseimaritima multifibrata]QDS91785.1 Segregation and condensation protein B [Roseimaritima multifibrata]